MKIGLLGSSLESVFLASYFSKLEAHVSLFGELDPLAIFHHYEDQLDRDYWFSLLKELQGKITFNSDEVARIQKTSIQMTDSAPRMKDTFRIVTRKNDLDYYEDFDFIIETKTLSKWTSFIGGDAPAINELNYNKKSFGFFNEDNFSEKEIKETDNSFAIVGDFDENKNLLDFLIHWIEKENKELHLFQNNKNSNFINYENEKFEKQIEAFEKTKEFEPKRKVFLYPYSNILSIDYLEDRERLYLTTEIPEFRVNESHFSTLGFKTIAVDALVQLREVKLTAATFHRFVLEPEEGYYKVLDEIWSNFTELQETAEKLKNEFLQYFKKA